VPTATAFPTAAPLSALRGTGSSSLLAPFFPPGFRDWSANAPAPTAASAAEAPPTWMAPTPVWSAEPVAQPSAAEDLSTGSLPWIEAYAHDDGSVPDSLEVHNVESNEIASGQVYAETESTPEDSWVMGEAGKRLDELTQSLTSLDLSRAAQAAKLLNESTDPNVAAEPSALPMWGDDEWMDIMPTSTVMTPHSAAPPRIHAEPVGGAASYYDAHNQRALEEAAAEAIETHARHSEAAAVALESVARRIRAGEVPIPEFDGDMGDAAVLAGILASLLRSGR
jgi:hypothetical protein